MLLLRTVLVVLSGTMYTGTLAAVTHVAKWRHDGLAV
jgi:hypothetical protein